MKKRIFSLFLAVVAVFALSVPAFAGVEGVVTTFSGKCGDNVTWRQENGVLTISGTGPMWDYGTGNLSPWYYDRGITSVIIKSGVTTIGDCSFLYCEGIKSVTIPSTVYRIGSEAFAACNSLPSIVIPRSVTSIRASAFGSCLALKTVTVMNPNCTIESGEYGTLGMPVSTVTVKGYAGSTAEEYARRSGNAFQSMGSAPSGGTMLAAPKLSSVANTASGIQIKWNPVSGAERYLICYKTTGGWKKLATTTKTSYLAAKAKDGVKYTFTVRCVSADGKTYASSYDTKGLTITCSRGNLPAPKLTVVTSGTYGVEIKWQPVTGAARYLVCYKTTGGWKKLATTTNTSYTASKAKNGVTYTFTVRCVSADGTTYTSGYDAKGMTITCNRGSLSTETLTTPEVAEVKNTTTGVRVSWQAVEGAVKYRVYWRTASTGWKKIKRTTTGTNYTVTGLTSGVKYTFTVRAYDKYGKLSGYTGGQSITYMASPQITTIERTATGIRVNWDPVAGATKYWVYWRASSPQWKVLGDPRTGTSVGLSGMTSGATYWFTIQACAADGTLSSYTGGKGVVI